MTKTTTTTTTKNCTHGLPASACVACRPKATKRSAESLTLATVPVVLELHGKRATLTPREGRNGSYRVDLSPTNARTDADARTAAGLTFPDPAEVFGTHAVPTEARVIVGGVTATGRARKGASVVTLRPDVEVKDGLATGVIATAALTHEGEPMVATLRVRVQRNGGWYVTASVRPGKAPVPTKRPATAALDGNPFA